MSIREAKLYEPTKDVVREAFTNIGDKFSNEVKPLAESKPEVFQAHLDMRERCQEYYGMDELALLALDDAFTREVFNSRERNRYSINELDISHIKAWFTSKVFKGNERSSQGLGNIKAFRITQDVYDQLPSEVTDVVPFNKEKGYAEPTQLSEYLNPDNVISAYQRTGLIYGAVYAAHKDEINSLQGLEDWQKRYIISVLMCCTDPVEEGKPLEELPYDNGFRLMRDATYAQKHMQEVEDKIRTRQQLSKTLFLVG